MEKINSPRYLTVVEESDFERDTTEVLQGYYKSNLMQSKSQAISFNIDQDDGSSSHDSVEPLKIFDITMPEDGEYVNNKASQRLSY